MKGVNISFKGNLIKSAFGNFILQAQDKKTGNVKKNPEKKTESNRSKEKEISLDIRQSTLISSGLSLVVFCLNIVHKII